jgi:4-hydroxybenzoyl-CoA thioesterase
VTFRCELPVRFADVDHAGIVYFPRFFHYVHVAFEELWRARLGAAAYRDLLDRDRIGFPAVHAECDFRSPLAFGDTAEIELSIGSPPVGKSLDVRYRVWRAATATAPRMLAAEGRVVHAVVDLSRFVAIPMPERVAALFADLVEP